MRLIGSSYKSTLPWYIVTGLVFAGLMAAIAFFFFCAAMFKWQPLKLGDYGTQGDFFGGHVAAVVGSITLLMVLLTGYLQLTFERRFRLREHFLSGISIIGQYDIAHPGCEQALRLLDYYSSVALELEEEELLLLLNTVMTDEIRRRLEITDGPTKEAYLDAKAARKKIQETLADYHLKRKGIKK